MAVVGFGGLALQGEANGNALFGLRIVIVERHQDHSKENRKNQSPGDFLANHLQRRPCDEKGVFCWKHPRIANWVCPHIQIEDPHLRIIRCAFPKYGSFYKG
jgi:hypothetical protein